MTLIFKTTFACIDCESTGLDPQTDRIIEVAVSIFCGDRQLESLSTLIDPQVPIPKDSQLIHHIDDQMVKDQPLIQSVLPQVHNLVQGLPIVGHGIGFDIDLLNNAALCHRIPSRLKSNRRIDTLRLARLYGQVSSNSLENLRQHFNIPDEGAHRAMGDVRVNIAVFLHLAKQFRTFEEMLARLEKPIEMRTIPLGKHKGRLFRDIPLDYLQWAAAKRFDLDLQFSIQKEMRRRKQQRTFGQAINPFHRI